MFDIFLYFDVFLGKMSSNNEGNKTMCVFSFFASRPNVCHSVVVFLFL